MRRQNNLPGLLATICLISCLQIPLVSRAEDNGAVVQLNILLAQINNLSSPISQSVISADGEVLQQLTGQVTVAKPGQFRIETSDPMPQTLVSDGMTLWNYDPDLEQLIISKLSQDIGEVPILILSGNTNEISEKYRVETYIDESGSHFVLVPKLETSLFSRITLSFADLVPSQIVIVDSFNQKTEIRFVDVHTNQPLAEGVFTFMAPEGTDVISDV